MITTKHKPFWLFFLLLISANVSQAQLTISHNFGDSPLPEPSGVINTSAGNQQGRLFRTGIATTCTSNYPASGFNVGTTHAFETFTFRANTTGCLEIDVTQTSTSLYVAVYSGAYDPNNITANRVAEQGSSLVGPFGGEVVGGQEYTLVIMESGLNAPGTPYTITLDNVMEPVSVPISRWWVLSTVVFMLGFLAFRNRTKEMKPVILTLVFLLASLHSVGSGLNGKFIAETNDGQIAVLFLESDGSSLSGTLAIGSSTGIIKDGTNDGEQLSFVVNFPEHDVPVAYNGTIGDGNTIEVSSSGSPGGEVTLAFSPEAK